MEALIEGHGEAQSNPNIKTKLEIVIHCPATRCTLLGLAFGAFALPLISKTSSISAHAYYNTFPRGRTSNDDTCLEILLDTRVEGAHVQIPSISSNKPAFQSINAHSRPLSTLYNRIEAPRVHPAVPSLATDICKLNCCKCSQGNTA